MNTNKPVPFTLLLLFFLLSSCAQSSQKAEESPVAEPTSSKPLLTKEELKIEVPENWNQSKPVDNKKTTILKATTQTDSKSEREQTSSKITVPSSNTSASETYEAQNVSSKKMTNIQNSIGTTTTTTPQGSKLGGKVSGTTTTGGTTTTTTSGVGKQTTTSLTGSGANFTESEAANAIKEALIKGITTGVNKVSVTNGYFGNGMIKIPFPKDAKVVETTLRQAGMGSMIDKMVLSLNRAAESAAQQAGPIFLNGIKQMSITDAINIVSNTQPDAATQFLQRTTTESLVSAFKPSIKTALDKTMATKYWSDIMNTYNKIPFVKKVNTDLVDFTTRKAISGLFYMISLEEAKIRKDPLARTTDVLQKVFGGLKF